MLWSKLTRHLHCYTISEQQRHISVPPTCPLHRLHYYLDNNNVIAPVILHHMNATKLYCDSPAALIPRFKPRLWNPFCFFYRKTLKKVAFNFDNAAELLLNALRKKKKKALQPPKKVNTGYLFHAATLFCPYLPRDQESLPKCFHIASHVLFIGEQKR